MKKNRDVRRAAALARRKEELARWETLLTSGQAQNPDDVARKIQIAKTDIENTERNLAS